MANAFTSALFGDKERAPSVSQASVLTDDQGAALKRLNRFFDSQIGQGEERYGGQLTADESALQNILFGGSEQVARNIFDPNYSSDVFQRTVADPALRNFNQEIAPNIAQQFSNAGALGSSGLNRALARAGQDLTQTLSAQQGQFVQNQKNQQLSDILGLSQLGGQQRGIDQERVGNEYNEFIRTLATRNPALNLSGAALGTRAFENIVDPGRPRSSGLFEQFASGVAQAGGQAAGGGIASFFSDVRLKEDINYLYQLSNGVNVYSYKYKGIDQEARGFLAQEVQKIIPEAVGESDGFLTVNYDMVIEHDKEARKITWQ
jgi:hypothetical protein